MMMGDLVLTESEINPVMSKLLAEGVQVTALHNHLLRANPPTFTCMSPRQAIPRSLRRLRSHRARGEPDAVRHQASSGSRLRKAAIDFDTAKVDAAIGHKGK